MAILDDGINRRGVSQSGVLAALLVMAIVWPLSAAGPAVATSQAPAQVRVGGQVREPVKIKDVKPAYPESAKAAGMQGIVIMEIRVDSDGSVVDAKVLRPIGEPLDSAAMDAVLQWRFMPTLLNGSPVEILMTVTINFRLDADERSSAQPVNETAPALPTATLDPITWSPGDPPLRVGGAVKEPKKLKDVKPAYPADAMAAGISGIVILEILVDEAGFVTDATVLRSIELLDEAARAAVLQWKFVPTVVNGVPAPVVMTVTVNFTL
jgi:TonB family protein